jgi:potassium-transporting ATPase KdpC subunit
MKGRLIMFLKNLLISLRLLAVMIVMTGVLYPLFITLTGHLFFYEQVTGSLISINDKIVGSKLIGQKFTDPGYFWGRPSASDHNTLPAGASNLGYTSAVLLKNIEDQKKLYSNTWKKEIPKDLLFSSGSGIDPHISPNAARFQIDRIAEARKYDFSKKNELKDLVERSIEKRDFGILGEERINVLLLNLSLNKIR